MKTMDNKKTRIAEQINGSFICIDSIEEFDELIEDFPDDPAIYKAHADFMVKKKSSDKAALSYGRAAALYLKSGKLLPAVLTKLLQWRFQLETRPHFTWNRSHIIRKQRRTLKRKNK